MSIIPLVTGFLVFARIGALMMIMPGFSAKGVPSMARLGAALPLSVVLYPSVSGTRIPLTVPALLGCTVTEVMLGLAMGMVVSMCYGAMSMAADIMASKMGFSIGGMLNPLSHTSESPLGLLCTWLATAVFFVTDTHLKAISAVAASFSVLPPGAIVHPMRLGGVLVEVATSVCMLSVQLAGPIVAFVMMVNVAMMMLGRMAPNLQLFFSIGTTVTVVAGVALLTAAMPSLLGVYAHGLEDIPKWIAALVEVSGG